MKKRAKLTGPDACVAMHAALRKCCDSKITTCVYNLISLIDFKPEKFDPWRLLGDLVAGKVNAGVPPEAALHEAAAVLDDRWTDVLLADRHPPENSQAALHALNYALKCFAEEDWAGMAAFLAEG